jgi:glycerol-3-phosphate acyltransferase PlsY
VLALPGAGLLMRAFGIVIALLVILRHRENIGRLVRGTERRFEWKRST